MLKAGTDVNHTLSLRPCLDTQAPPLAEGLTFVPNEMTIIPGVFCRSPSDGSMESLISNASSGGDDDESKAPLTASDSRDDWINELIKLAVDHYQQRCDKSVCDTAEMDRISEQYHLSYIKYITFYIKFDVLFIKKSLTQNEAIKDGMLLFDYSDAKLGAKGFEAYLRGHFQGTSGCCLRSTEGAGASDTSPVTVTLHPEARPRKQPRSLKTSRLNDDLGPVRPLFSVKGCYLFDRMAGGPSDGSGLVAIERQKHVQVCATSAFDFFKKRDPRQEPDALENVSDAIEGLISLGKFRTGGL